MRQETLAAALAKVVVQALVRYGFTQDDVLKGEIRHTELPWQIPPLVCEMQLFGVPLGTYFESVGVLKVDALYSLWSDALLNMKNSPDKVLTPDGFRAVSYALPLVRASERYIHLSLPEGYPGGISDFAGIMLSLECAHLMRYNARHSTFVCDEDNYYAVTEEGMEIGIKAGLPVLYDDVWDMPVNGMVQEMLQTPRGAVWEGCDYNIISKVRSVTHELGNGLRDAEGVDWALQTLRVIDGDKELLAAVRNMRAVQHVTKLRLSLLQQAWFIATQMSITDRQRIETLKQMLVPEVLTPGQFSKQVFPYTGVAPAVLKDTVLTRLQEGVRALLDAEEQIQGSTIK